MIGQTLAPCNLNINFTTMSRYKSTTVFIFNLPKAPKITHIQAKHYCSASALIPSKTRYWRAMEYFALLVLWESKLAVFELKLLLRKNDPQPSPSINTLDILTLHSKEQSLFFYVNASKKIATVSTISPKGKWDSLQVWVFNCYNQPFIV